MKRRQVLSLAVLPALAACGSSDQIKAEIISVGEATGVLTAQGEINLYGVAKGLAFVASASVPSLQPAIQQAMSIADPLAQLVQQGEATMADVAKLSEQTKQLTLVAAPYIKVVPNGITTTAATTPTTNAKRT